MIKGVRVRRVGFLLIFLERRVDGVHFERVGFLPIFLERVDGAQVRSENGAQVRIADGFRV